MFPTIYNLLMIIICAVLAYAGLSTYLITLYFILCAGALYTTYRLNCILKKYPHIEPKLVEAVNLVFDDSEYILRYMNLVCSYLIHAIIVVVCLGNYSLLAAITGVLIYRVVSLVSNKQTVREYQDE